MNHRTILSVLLALSLNGMLVACAENATPNQPTSPISEMAIGEENAPITMIEYASMTCGHCAQFHIHTLPKLKKDYINQGKLRLVFREFPLDPSAVAGAMLARCVGRNKPKRFFAFLDILFQKQAQWVNAEDRMTALQKLAQQAGISQKTSKQCFENEKLLSGIYYQRKLGEKDGIAATPSFLINGTLVEGNQPYNLLKSIIDEALR